MATVLGLGYQRTLDYIRDLVQTEPRVLATVDHPRIDHQFRGGWMSRSLCATDDAIVWVVGARATAPFAFREDEGVSLVIGVRRQLDDLRRFRTFYAVPPRQLYSVHLRFSGPADKPLGQVHLYGWQVPYRDEHRHDLLRSVSDCGWASNS